MNQLVERESTAVAEVAPSQATSLLQAITAAAANKDVDIEKMRQLFQMHKEMVAIEAEAAFNAAMARAQAKIEPVVGKAYNTQTQSYYAKLAAINKVITPLYTAEGIRLSFSEGDCPKPDWFRTLAKVSHSAGHSEMHHLDLPLDDVGAKGTVNKTKVHATGSTSSYARRYLTCMIFNVSTGDDNDGNGTVGGGQSDAEPDPAGKKALEACGSMRTLTETWNKLPKEARGTLSAVMNECRARLKAAEQA
jgi:hypothetical protein